MGEDMVKGFENFNKENMDNLSEIHGVYVLAVGLKNSDNVRVFYVGSGNIPERLAYHLSDDEENECVKEKVQNKVCYFWYEEVKGGEDKREKREGELIDYYKGRGNAKCNKNRP